MSAAMNALSSKLNFYNTTEDPMDGGANPNPGLLGKFLPSMANPAGGGGGHEEEQEGLLPKLGSVAKNSMVHIHRKATGAVNTVTELTISRERWAMFFVAEALGALLMSASFAFLPFIVLAPQKFALTFTLGSLSFLSGFAVLKGYTVLIGHLMDRERLPFSSAYVGTMLGTLYASLVYRSYLLTLAFSVGQICALVYFFVSYIPGGTRMLNFMAGLFCGCAKRLCCKDTGGYSLPL